MLTVGLILGAVIAAAPGPRLLDVRLRPPEPSGGVDLSLPSTHAASWVAMLDPAAGPREGSARGREAASDPPSAAEGGGAEQGTPEPAPPDREHPDQSAKGKAPEQKTPPSLDFDLLGAAPKTAAVDEGALRRRRTLLQWHQAAGLGMFTLQLATTVVGQLNYDDKFGGDNTNKYAQTHAVLAYATLASFAAAGTLALLAPAPIKRSEGFDRVSLHKLAMFTAAAGMVAQGVLGVWTQSREGYLNQQGIATAHLVVGYVTLAAVATGVGALVF